METIKIENNVQLWREFGKTVLLVLISLGLFINYLFNNDILSLLCTVAACSYLILCSENNLIPTMLYLSSFAYLFRFSGYALYEFVCIAFLFRAILKHRNHVIYTALILPIYLSTHIVSSDIRDITFGEIIPFIVIMCLFFSCCIYNQGSRDQCIKCFIVGHVVSTILGFFKGYTRLVLILGDDYLTTTTWQDTKRFAGLSYDANFYSLVAIVSLSYLILKAKADMSFIKWISLTVFTIVTGMLTYSKSYYLCLVVLLVVAVFGAENETKKKIFKAVPIAILVGFIFRDQVIQILNIFLNRFTEAATADSLTSGRYSLWVQYIPKIFSGVATSLFGHGVNSYGILTSKGVVAAHNTYLEVLYKFGIIGTFIDVIYVALSSNKMMRCKSKGTINWVIIGIFLALIFNLSAYTFYGLWACIFMLWLITSKSTMLDEGFYEKTQYYCSSL